jgi:hypothetical protein
MSQQVGLDMKLYYDDDDDWDDPDFLEVDNCRDLTGPDSFVEADVSIRGNGLKLAEPTLEDISFEWEMVHDPANAAFVYFHNKFLTKGKCHICLADGDIETPGTKFTRLEVKVFKLDRAEPLEGAATRALMVKPCWSARIERGTVAEPE